MCVGGRPRLFAASIVGWAGFSRHVVIMQHQTAATGAVSPTTTWSSLAPDFVLENDRRPQAERGDVLHQTGHRNQAFSVKRGAGSDGPLRLYTLFLKSLQEASRAGRVRRQVTRALSDRRSPAAEDEPVATAAPPSTTRSTTRLYPPSNPVVRNLRSAGGRAVPSGWSPQPTERYRR